VHFQEKWVSGRSMRIKARRLQLLHSVSIGSYPILLA
jgi:hypothetical protein